MIIALLVLATLPILLPSNDCLHDQDKFVQSLEKDMVEISPNTKRKASQKKRSQENNPYVEYKEVRKRITPWALRRR